MSVLDIVTWPDARLTAVCAPVATRTPEIDRLIERGARPIDVGQNESASWTVLSDPEGNEFCVLSARDS